VTVTGAGTTGVQKGVITGKGLGKEYWVAGREPAL
jgi:hypothetical protein